MKKLFGLLASILLIGGVIVAEGGLSFIGGVNAGNGSITLDGKIGGYGNDQDVYIQMDINGQDSATFCQNPGGNVAPGQPVDVFVVDTFTVSPDSNGNYEFNFRESYMPSKAEADCPNGKWEVFGVEGTLDVTVGVYEAGATEPADEQVFRCEVNLNTLVDCPRIK